MSFTSVVFLILFFPICILFSYLMRKEYRNVFVCICSILFYFWCGIKFLILIMISASMAYAFGLLIARIRKQGVKRAVLLLGIAYNVGVLFFYKYLFNLFPEFTQTWAHLLGNDGASVQSPVLPLGISFYTFSVLSYILDVYWEKCSAQKNILNVWLYVLFFPKVVQGPIMRYQDFESQLYGRELNADKLYFGFERFIKGMFKKVMIADQVSGLVTYSFSNIDSVGTIPAWIGIIAYLLQLYYDFAGYSDMAIGLGLMLGFELPENFDHPYISFSVAEYWRRWHISLGEWFRDYVYMPCSRTVLGMKWLAGFKKKKMLVCDVIALFFTWILTGIWHGSGKKYVVWGLWWFIFIVFERLRSEYRRKSRKNKNQPLKVNTWWQTIGDYLLTSIAVVFGQVIFRSTNLSDAIRYWKRMLFWNTADRWTFLHQFDNYTVFAMMMGIVFVFPLYGVIREKVFNRNEITLLLHKVILLAIAFVTFCYAVSAGYTAFLYEVF